jgi:hypothetical protein
MNQTFDEIRDNIIMSELNGEISDTHVGGAYLVAMYMGGEWVLKVGQTKNFYNRIKQLNNQYEIQGDVLYNYSYDIPRIIPLVVYFTNDIYEMDIIEKVVKKFMNDYNLLTSQYHRFGGTMTEVSNISSDVYDVFVNFCNKCENGVMWESTSYELDDDNTLSYNVNDEQIILHEVTQNKYEVYSV